ncbi:MAG: efflux RND transporter permease subunit [Rubrivivax sp.]|nr:efflux RND transporter permease subunit [Rubrivivax sp.]
MHTLARVCVERPVFATVLSLVLLVVGYAGYRGLGIDRFPNVDFPMVMVVTAYPGAGPAEVETEITDRIERQVNTIAGIETLRSTSSEGLSLVMMQFELSKDVDVAAEEVRAKVALARSDLPPDAEEPVVSKFDLGAVPVLSYAVAAERPLREVYEYADKVLRRRIESVSGVGEVQIIGGRERQINIVLDLYRLQAYGITAWEVKEALQDGNFQIPGGAIERGDRELLLRTQGRVRSVAEFGAIPITTYGDQVVTVGDVATIEDGESRASSLASINGRETVVLQVVKQSGANAISVIDAVKERLELVKLPPGYQLVKVRDQSTYIEAALHAVQEHLLLGAVLAALVVLLFLRSSRSTVIAAVAIPLSIIATFAVMKVFGFTQNLVTLLALTLSVGIVIDDAIVVLENIFRVLEEKGLSPHDAAIQATREIGLAVLAITLSLIAVFLPVAFMGGIVGRFLNSFGITMAAAIGVSLFVSFTLTPMLCARWLRGGGPGQAGQEAHSKSGWFALFDQGFTAMLTWSMAHRWVVLVGSTALMLSVPLLGLVAKKNFLPDDDESQFQVVVRAPEGTSLEGTRAILEEMAKPIRALPEVKLVVVTVGDDDSGSANSGTVYAKMNEVEERQDRSVTEFTLLERVREEILPRFQGRGLRLSAQQASAFGGTTYDIEMAVSGPDLAVLGDAAEKLVRRVRTLPGVADADTTLITGKPELQAEIDRERAASLGRRSRMSPGSSASALAATTRSPSSTSAASSTKFTCGCARSSAARRARSSGSRSARARPQGAGESPSTRWCGSARR